MSLFKNILYVSEASSDETPTMARAVSLAENNQADLTVVSVVPTLPAGKGTSADGPASSDLQSAMVEKRLAELHALIQPYSDTRRIKTQVLVGQMYLEVIRAVLRNDYDLVIKPAGNPDFIERLFETCDMQLLRMCPCPVWLTGPNEKANYARILAAVDFNMEETANPDEVDLNQQILDLASSLALSDFAELHILHVWDAPAEMMVRAWASSADDASIAYVEGERVRHEMAFNHFRDTLREKLGKDAYEHLAPQFHLRRGIASTVIPETAKKLQADLLVMGTVARTGIAGLFIGNTAENVLEQLQCSVLAIKPHGFVTPVKLTDQ